MGYLDAVTSGYFKTTQDGSKLFFPWGVSGRGYVVASEQHFERLQRQFKFFWALSFVLIIGSSSLPPHWGAFAIGALVIVYYAIWMQFLLRRLRPSQERLSLKESMAAVARAHSDRSLWLSVIGALAFVGAGILPSHFRSRQQTHRTRLHRLVRTRRRQIHHPAYSTTATRNNGRVLRFSRTPSRTPCFHVTGNC
jgi:hypothetical protein